MNEDSAARLGAQDGLQRVENAVLELLHRNPQGLRNIQIANMLGLRSEARGDQRNYLTYSVLGRLSTQGRVAWDEKTKLYTTVDADTTPQSSAEEGLLQIEGAILELLHQNPQGLGNSQVADSLDLHSAVRGGRRNFLTYSIIGGLIEKGQVIRNESTKRYTKAQGEA